MFPKAVLSPTLFSIYTNEININSNNLTLIKYADDMALVACLDQKSPPTAYLQYIQSLVAWSDNSFLDLNINKTKELCFGGTQGTTKDAIRIKGQQVEQLSSFKYLGTILDGKPTFTENRDSIYKKARQRLFRSLRRLRNLNVAAPILVSVYGGLIESIMTFNMVTWYGDLSVPDKPELSQIINEASKMTGVKQAPLQHLYGLAMKRKALQIVDDFSSTAFFLPKTALW